jgi:hypothetical protein
MNSAACSEVWRAGLHVIANDCMPAADCFMTLPLTVGNLWAGMQFIANVCLPTEIVS